MPDSITGEAIATAMGEPSAAATSATSTTTAADASSAAGTATTQPAVAGDQNTVTAQTDPAQTTTTAKVAAPPEEKWPTILENTRAKEYQRGVTETEARFASVKDLPQSDVTVAAQLVQYAKTQPVNALDLMFQQIVANPEMRPALLSWIGRTLGGSRTQARTEQTDAMPEPDFEDQTTGAKFYSAERLAQRDAALERRITASLEKRYGPVEHDYKTRQQREHDAEVNAQMKRDADVYAEKQWAEVQTWPHFAKFKDEIGAAMLAETSLDVRDAYIRIAVPKLSMQERSDVVASLNHKADAASFNPSNPVTAASGRPKTFKEAFARLPAGALG